MAGPRPFVGRAFPLIAASTVVVAIPIPAIPRVLMQQRKHREMVHCPSLGRVEALAFRRRLSARAPRSPAMLIPKLLRLRYFNHLPMTVAIGTG